ncbi:unnamed protein product [Albugo candida]|uniref:Uncharacterized protein n=1 Tax=Albugo candida TaxID=65357 RepID=A0A024GJY1_9STRA|nr:unnamed protein product [Albugo candida]|eukprot:CCI47072.1 unnamed protein product [Albugo candida]
MDCQLTTVTKKCVKKSKNALNGTTSTSWTPEEDEILRGAVYKHGGKKWKTIATFFDGRGPTECNVRWNQLQNHGSAVKKPWCPSEDMRMLELVMTHGAGKWAVIASYLPGRNGKQCRERWHNQLNPAIKKGPWTVEEDQIIMEMQSKYGNRWAKITERLPGRTDNAVKNHWHSSMKSKLKKTGSDDSLKCDGGRKRSESMVEKGCYKRTKKSNNSLSATKFGRAVSPDTVDALGVDKNELEDPLADLITLSQRSILEDTNFGALLEPNAMGVPKDLTDFEKDVPELAPSDYPPTFFDDICDTLEDLMAIKNSSIDGYKVDSNMLVEVDASLSRHPMESVWDTPERATLVPHSMQDSARKSWNNEQLQFLQLCESLVEGPANVPFYGTKCQNEYQSCQSACALEPLDHAVGGSFTNLLDEMISRDAVTKLDKGTDVTCEFI